MQWPRSLDLAQTLPIFAPCIQSRADALANLPNLGKVVSRKGMRPFGNEAGRANRQPSSVKPKEGFLCRQTRQTFFQTTLSSLA
jgi:hypothetical protein